MWAFTLLFLFYLKWSLVWSATFSTAFLFLYWRCDIYNGCDTKKWNDQDFYTKRTFLVNLWTAGTGGCAFDLVFEKYPREKDPTDVDARFALKRGSRSCGSVATHHYFIWISLNPKSPTVNEKTKILLKLPHHITVVIYERGFFVDLNYV